MDLQAEYDAITAAIRDVPSYYYDNPVGAHINQIDLAIAEVRRRRLHRHTRIQYRMLQWAPPCLAQLVADYAVDFGFRLVDRAADGICSTAILRPIATGGTHVIAQLKMFGAVVAHDNPRHLELIFLAMLVRRGIVARICPSHAWYVCINNECHAIDAGHCASQNYQHVDATMAGLLAMPHHKHNFCPYRMRVHMHTLREYI